MNETKQGNDENVNSKTYIKKGFWISLGAAAGIGITALSAGILLILVFYRIEITSRINQSWKPWVS